MTYSDIEAFIAVARYKNISYAAEKLYITQPALTKKIQSLEKETGYSLFRRRKGQKALSLTDEGRSFMEIALKWQSLWEETNEFSAEKKNRKLSVAGINTFNRYIFPNIAPKFISQGYRLTLFHAQSEEAYMEMDHGLYDISFITMQEYNSPIPDNVISKPAYSERMLIASTYELPSDGNTVDADKLNPEEEIYLPWNIDFMKWHEKHSEGHPYITLDDITIAEMFLGENRWMYVNYMMSLAMKEKGLHIYRALNEPPKAVIYSIMKKGKLPAAESQFMKLLDDYIRDQPSDMMESFISV